MVLGFVVTFESRHRPKRLVGLENEFVEEQDLVRGEGMLHTHADALDVLAPRDPNQVRLGVRD